MKKATVYVAPCVRELNLPDQMNQRSCDIVVGIPFVTPQHDGVAFWTVILGLFLTVGGAGAAEQINMIPGIIAILIGIVLMYHGVIRLPRN